MPENREGPVRETLFSGKALPASSSGTDYICRRWMEAPPRKGKGYREMWSAVPPKSLPRSARNAFGAGFALPAKAVSKRHR